MNAQEYQTAKSQLKAYNSAADRYMKENKTNGIPGEICKTFPFADVVTNDLRSEVEVYEFINEKPLKYFLYVDEKTAHAITWTG